MSSGAPPLVSFLRAFCPLGLGVTIGYSFANPDEDNIYDVFPVQKSQYCFISAYTVPQDQRRSFEGRWKNLARFYQQQDGYLFNKLIRSDSPDENGCYLFMDFNQWSTGDAYKVACSRGGRDEMYSAIKDVCIQVSKDSFSHPMMYKTVVDDTRFTPSEVLQARSPGNVAARLSADKRLG